MTRMIKVDPFALDPDAIHEAVHILKNGGLVVYPTRCLYGLGADATNRTAVEKVFAVKQRSLDRPISVLCRDAVCLRRIVKQIPARGERIMRRFWPGWVTIVFEANDMLPAVVTAGSGKIGVRLPANPVAAALVAGLGHPITATSANISGDDGCSRIQDLPHTVLDRVDLVLDAGVLESGPGSTVVDVTGDEPVILREGMVSADSLGNLYPAVF